jgi:aconitate hydratase
VSAGIARGDLSVVSVLSGNRNFEGRVHAEVKMNYLASPPLVVAYALAGSADIDLSREPLGTGSDGQPVFLRDIWPSNDEIAKVIDMAVLREQFVERYAHADVGPPEWQAVVVSQSDVYPWDEASTYVQEPPFFVGMSKHKKPIEAIKGARMLVQAVRPLMVMWMCMVFSAQ